SEKATSSRASWGPFSSAAPEGRTRSSGASASRAARTNPAIAAGAGATRATSRRSSRAAAASRSRTLSTRRSRAPGRARAFAGLLDQTRCSAPRLMHHLFVTVVLALELDGGVLDRESVAQHRFRLGEDLVVAAAIGSVAAHHDVTGQGDEAAGDGPDVEVMHGRDARDVGDGRGDVRHRDV